MWRSDKTFEQDFGLRRRLCNRCGLYVRFLPFPPRARVKKKGLTTRLPPPPPPVAKTTTETNKPIRSTDPTSVGADPVQTVPEGVDDV